MTSESDQWQVLHWPSCGQRFELKARISLPWHSVKDFMPLKRELVLVRGPSGYGGHETFIEAAYYDPDYRPHSPWITVQSDRLSDRYPEGPTHWREIGDLMEIPL